MFYVIRLLIPRNAEALAKLVTLGKLPVVAHPPPNLVDNPTSIFSSWLSSLPLPIKSMVLSYVTECNLEKQFSKVSKNR